MRAALRAAQDVACTGSDTRAAIRSDSSVSPGTHLRRIARFPQQAALHALLAGPSCALMPPSPSPSWWGAQAFLRWRAAAEIQELAPAHNEAVSALCACGSLEALIMPDAK